MQNKDEYVTRIHGIIFQIYTLILTKNFNFFCYNV